MTTSERPLQELLVMLIEQKNARGGLLGRPIEPIIMNPGSDPKRYAEQAHKLIAEHKVAAIFGCWTSASRKEVLPIVEREGSLLFYPSQYEGQETSPNIFYTGATPHQQAVPAVNFLRTLGHRRFFLVGSDNIYSRTTNAVLKGYLKSQGTTGDMIAERYVGPAFTDWRVLVEDIRRFAKGKQAVIIATVSGDANLHFFRELSRQHMTADKIPVMSLSINEAEPPSPHALQPGRTHGGVELPARLRPQGEPRLHRRLAPLHRAAETHDQRFHGSHLDRISPVDRGGGSRRHDRHRQGAGRAGRPPDRGAERLQHQDGQQDPSPVQAGDDRPHRQGRGHRPDLGHRRPGAAGTLEPMAGTGTGRTDEPGRLKRSRWRPNPPHFGARSPSARQSTTP
jgi:hypothetical protein